MISIHPATEADFDSFMALIDALAEYEKLEAPDSAARERLRRDGFGDQPRFRAYLADLDGRAVAYAITYHTYSSFLARPTLFLEDIFVLPEARRHGIGKAFFRHLAAQAVDDGCGRMEWMVLDWNQPAMDFYERMGGQRLDEWHTYRLTREQLSELSAEGRPS